jgi:hypothetical protein
MDILEIQEMIFMYLSQRERSKIKRVCKSFRDMCDSIWERLYHKQKPVKQIWFENHILLKNDKRSFLSRKRNLRIRTPKLILRRVYFFTLFILKILRFSLLNLGKVVHYRFLSTFNHKKNFITVFTILIKLIQFCCTRGQTKDQALISVNHGNSKSNSRNYHW